MEELYNISTKSLMQKHTEKPLSSLNLVDRQEVQEKAAKELVHMVQMGWIGFPYQRLFRLDASILFDNLCKSYLEPKKDIYQLRSYYPRYGSFLPAMFRNEPLTLSVTKGCYPMMDVLSDYFIEHVRLKAKRHDQNVSIMQSWEDPEVLLQIMKHALTRSFITPEILRNVIYEHIPETKIFPPSLARAVLLLVMTEPTQSSQDSSKCISHNSNYMPDMNDLTLNEKKPMRNWIDVVKGCEVTTHNSENGDLDGNADQDENGDRTKDPSTNTQDLLTSNDEHIEILKDEKMENLKDEGRDNLNEESSENVKIEENLKGKKWLDISAGWGDRLLAAMSLGMEYVGYDPNVELREGHSKMIEMFGDTKKHKVIYEPFEKANVTGGPYDVIFTSPPYYTVEEYARGQKGQSIVSYPELPQWMVWFLFASLMKAWQHLNDGGYLILHLGDAKTVKITEATNIFIKNHLPFASWEGIIGIKCSVMGFIRPIWVWRKMNPTSPIKAWTPLQWNGKMPPHYHHKSSLLHQLTLFHTYPSFQSELINLFASSVVPTIICQKDEINLLRSTIYTTATGLPRSTIATLLSNDLMIYSLLSTIGYSRTLDWALDLVHSNSNVTTFLLTDFVTTHAPSYIAHKNLASDIRCQIALRISFPSTILNNDLVLISMHSTYGMEFTVQWYTSLLSSIL